jgi:putative membrane protein
MKAKIASGLMLFVALEHLAFLVLEMFLWTSPTGMKVFKHTAEAAEQTKVLAMNQGLYNGFLAAGLIWALVNSDAQQGRRIGLFFLGCVVVAGIFGGVTAKLTILYVQGLPAAIAFLLLWLGRPKPAILPQT